MTLIFVLSMNLMMSHFNTLVAMPPETLTLMIDLVKGKEKGAL